MVALFRSARPVDLNLYLHPGLSLSHLTVLDSLHACTLLLVRVVLLIELTLDMIDVCNVRRISEELADVLQASLLGLRSQLVSNLSLLCLNVSVPPARIAA